MIHSSSGISERKIDLSICLEEREEMGCLKSENTIINMSSRFYEQRARALRGVENEPRLLE